MTSGSCLLLPCVSLLAREAAELRPGLTFEEWKADSLLPPWLWLHMQRMQWAYSPELWFPDWSAECQGAAATFFLFKHVIGKT